MSFASEPEGEDDLVAAVRAEMARLAPWAEQAPPPPTNGPLDLATAVADLAAVAGLRRDPSNGKEIGVEALRLAADDLRTWYLHAVAQQPGAATSAERMRWFWRETALGRLLGQLTARLLTDPDPMRRMLAERALVPRDHWGIVPDQPPTGDLDA